MPLTIKPVSTAVGAEISGVNFGASEARGILGNRAGLETGMARSCSAAKS